MTSYYDEDGITIYHADCRYELAWLNADVLVTDPPYGINNESRQGAYPPTRSAQVRRASPIAGDADTTLRDGALRSWGTTRPALVFGSWRLPRPQGTTHRLIWHKAGMPPGPTRAAFMTQDEEIYVLGDGFLVTSPPFRSVITTTEHRPTEVATIGHPTPKPIGLMMSLLERCPPGVVSDPFMGSGSTLVAAKRLGRRAVGIEIEERYCEIAVQRLAQGVLEFQ